MQPKLEKTESTETVNASEESGEEVSNNYKLRLSVFVFLLRTQKTKKEYVW